MTCNEEWRFGSVLLDAGALSDGQLREAAELLGHLNEASFGYRSGDPEPSLAGGTASSSSILSARRFAIGWRRRRRSLGARWRRFAAGDDGLQRRGLAGLVDGRHTRSVTGPGVDERLRAAIIAEARELESASDVRKMQFRARVASRLARESGEPLELPSSRQTFNRIVDDVLGRRVCSGCRRRAGAARRRRRARCSGR